MRKRQPYIPRFYRNDQQIRNHMDSLGRGPLNMAVINDFDIIPNGLGQGNGKKAVQNVLNACHVGRKVDHWLAGETTVELAYKSHLARSVVSEIITSVGKSRLETTDTKEQQPIYNVWNYVGCDPRFGQKHPGRT